MKFQKEKFQTMRPNREDANKCYVYRNGQAAKRNHMKRLDCAGLSWQAGYDSISNISIESSA